MTREADNTPMFEQEPIRSGESAGNDGGVALEERVIALEKNLEDAHREVSRNQEDLKRAQAEMVNFRRRTDEERIESAKFANSRLIARFLPIVEEMALAISSAEKNGTGDSWLDGIKLIQRKLLNLLESEGVTRIDAVGAAFDPLEHEALGTEETDRVEPGYITEVVRSGYRLHNRVIQPAQVIVARLPQ